MSKGFIKGCFAGVCTLVALIAGCMVIIDHFVPDEAVEQGGGDKPEVVQADEKKETV